MARPRPSRVKRARSSSTESTSDERLHHTKLREPSKRLKSRPTASEPGTFGSTSTQQNLALEDLTPFDVQPSESPGVELQEDPSCNSEAVSSGSRSDDEGYSSIDEADQGRVYPEGLPKVLPGNNPLINDPKWKHRLGLDWSDGQVDEYLKGLPILQFTKLSEEERNGIAPKGYWIAESEAVAQVYRPFFATRKLAEPRRPRRGVFLAEPSAWKWIVRTQDCGIFVDATDSDPEKHFVVGVVARDFLPEKEVLRWMQEVALRTVTMGRDARQDDNGRMVHHSYTKGARGKNPITAAVNIEKRYDPEILNWHQHDHVSIQSLLWNLARKKMPRSITQAFEGAMAGLPRSNWNTKRVDNEATSNISIKAGDVDLEFSTGPGGLELGPPSGVCASQYSKECHSDANHPLCNYVASLTTERNAGPERFGSFFWADYGIKVENSTNTFIVHRSDMLHGTTLHDVDPGCKDADALVESLVHSGWSMFVANGLEAALVRYEKFGKRKPDEDEEDGDFDPEGE